MLACLESSREADRDKDNTDALRSVGPPEIRPRFTQKCNADGLEISNPDDVTRGGNRTK